MQDNKYIYVTLQNSINTDGLWYPSISIYFSGCDKYIKCKDCHNKELQQKGNGFKTTSEELINTIDDLLINWFGIYDIISICYIGGEPLAEWNRNHVYKISKQLKEKYNDKVCNIIYSWRYIEDMYEIIDSVKYIDYGVLGDFKIDDCDLNYIPSSKNQYIYNFKTSSVEKPIRKG